MHTKIKAKKKKKKTKHRKNDKKQKQNTQIRLFALMFFLPFFFSLRSPPQNCLSPFLALPYHLLSIAPCIFFFLHLDDVQVCMCVCVCVCVKRRNERDRS